MRLIFYSDKELLELAYAAKEYAHLNSDKRELAENEPLKSFFLERNVLGQELFELACVCEVFKECTNRWIGILEEEDD